VLLAGASAARDIPAFPEAEGFGAMAVGGRGGKVIFVTNLNDAGPGSFREACMAKGPRIVVFRVGGLITLASPLKITEPYITIAGQTAPGDGICLRSNVFAVTTHDVVVRFLRSRLGDLTRLESDSIDIYTPSRNVILDHCSASWSIDETLSPTGDIANITVQWCLIAESLNRSFHRKGEHGYGSLVHATGGLTLHHNLWAHHTERNPRLGDNFYKPPFPTFDVRNNVMYNWSKMCSGLADGDIKVNYVNNYLRPGPSSSQRKPIVLRRDTASETVRYYINGNFVEGRPELTANNNDMFEPLEYQGKKLFTIVNAPYAVAPVRTQSPKEAYEAVLENAGATVPVRDAVDARIIADVRQRTGKIIDSQEEVGGWPDYRTAAPPPDADNDGVPDAWETAHGMNPRDAADARAVDAASGYTKLELYLNELARGGAPVVLARDGRANASIMVADAASPAERSAAGELASYLRKITGAAFPVRAAREKPPGTLIVVGKAADGLAPEGFRIRTQGGNLLLTGADDDGVEFAVYTFLEKYLGVRWFWPGELGEVVPRQSTVAVGPLDDTQKPDFLWRDRGPGGALWGATSGPTEMHARELLLGVTREHQRQVRLWEKRNKWGGWKVYGGHALGEIFPPEKFAKTHPDYYALVNGKRDVPGPDYDYKHRGQVCTTNPGVVEAAAEWVNRFYDAHPDYHAVHITMNDSAGFCECDRCRALDSGSTMKRAGIDAEETKGGAARNTVMTDRIYTFVNQVSGRVQKKHPGKYVVSMAYARYILPPEKIRLHTFAIPQYCLWGAYRHANAELKREHETIAAGWAKAAGMAGIYEYYINGSWPGLHRLVVPYLAESIRYLKRQGIRLYQVQSGDEFGTNGVNYYVAGKLLWDASADERAILDDFYAKAFGRVAPAVRRFHGRLEKAWTDATRDGQDVSCNSLENTRVAELFTPELMKAAAADLDEAAAAAENETIRKRVEFYRQGLRYTELTVEAVRAAKAVGASPDKRQVVAALEACRRRARFVEDLKNDYVLPYFWVRYNDEQRAAFLPVARLEALLKKLGD
jgi:pectate lyase